MSDKIYITKLKVTDIGGLAGEHEFALGMCSVIQGANGTGKSSLLNALHNVFERGNDPGLIHLGAEFGLVEIELSDGVRISKKIVSDGSDLKVRSKEGGLVKRPAEYIEGLASAMSWNPISFLDGDPKKRNEFILKNLDLQFEAAELNDILGGPVVGTTMRLDKFNELRDGRYAERTELNRKLRDLDGQMASLKSSLPKDDGKDWGKERDRLQDEIDGIAKTINVAESEIKAEAEETNKAKAQEIAAKIAEHESAIAAFREEKSNFHAEVLAEQTRAITERTKELEAQKSALALDLGSARANHDATQRAQGVRDAVAREQEKYIGLNSQEMALTRQLKALDELKAKKLKQVPIEGFDIEIPKKGEPVIKINGVDLAKLNRQSALFVAVQAVSLASGKLPLILLEGAELDSQHAEELAEALKEAGLQLVMARWKDGAKLSVGPR